MDSMEMVPIPKRLGGACYIHLTMRTYIEGHKTPFFTKKQLEYELNI